MLRNYLLISIRNLRKHFTYSLINVSGLGLGLCTCLLLVIWLRHEWSYDRFHENADRIYRGSLEYSFGGQVARTSVSPTALLPALLTLPEVETGTRVYNPSSWNPYILKRGDQLFQESRFYAADSTFFDVFSYELLSGDAHTALVAPYSVVLTESMARKYFPDEDPIGKTLNVNNRRDYTVTGVVKDPPTNSLLQFQFLSSFSSLRAAQAEPIWWSANYQTYVTLHPKASISSVFDKTNEIVKKAVGSEITGESDYVRYNFTPLTDIYLKSDFEDEPEMVSDIKYIYVFSAVAALILLIACINYVNLATARAADRAREVSLRKVVGAVRKQLIAQFIGESMVITFLAFMLGFLMANLFLPVFNELTGKHLRSELLIEPGFLGVAILVLFTIAVLAGAYPAFAITSFKPVSVLKGNFKASGKGIWLRKGLVVFQFGISVVLIAGTLVILKQLQFIQDKKLGYNRENVIVLPLDSQTDEVFEALKTELLAKGAAVQVGRGTESPVNIQGGYSISVGSGNTQGVVTTGLLVDEGYFDVVGLELIHGRKFTREDRERVNRDTVYTFILNEAALEALLIEPDSAIGMVATMGDRRGEIIGVIRDFHFSSLHRNIGPLVIFPEEEQFSKILIRIPEGNLPQRLADVGAIYSRIVTHRPFEYQFLDQQYQALYTNEQRLSSVFLVFAALAVIIACLGLLGLVAFAASQKTKEIGVRKVLGATAANIVLLITREFSTLVAVGIVIGLPVAYWMMSQWLQDFAYRIDVGLAPLAIASALCIVIAVTSAGYQAVKASLTDPAKTLRNE